MLYYLSKHHGSLDIDDSETSGKEARCYNNGFKSYVLVFNNIPPWPFIAQMARMQRTKERNLWKESQ